MINCPEPGSMVATAKGRVVTQYREAYKFLALVGAYLAHIEDAARAACAVPSAFDLDTASGDQLTIIGKWLGLPREHCVCDVPPVFGFACGEFADNPNIKGFCADGDVSWASCTDFETSTLVIRDDEIYRTLLKVRCYQYLALFDRDSLTTCIQLVWGSGAFIAGEGLRWVALGTGKALSVEEQRLLPVVLRVMPIAPGVRIKMSYATVPMFGFGEGYQGFCREAPKFFGFCAGFYGFCEDPEQARWYCPGEIESAWFCPVEFDPYACTPEASNVTSAFGFDCEGTESPSVSGFCAGNQSWNGCE